MEKKTARVIVTFKCNRNCPGCCNEHGNEIRNIEKIEDLLNYREIVITGGEPILLGDKLIDFLLKLEELEFRGKIFLYTAYFYDIAYFNDCLLSKIDGITYTLHAEATDEDIKMLKGISQEVKKREDKLSSRLMIDNRCYARYDFSNIDLTGWDVIRKLQWKDKCEPAPNEELMTLLL